MKGSGGKLNVFNMMNLSIFFKDLSGKPTEENCLASRGDLKRNPSKY